MAEYLKRQVPEAPEPEPGLDGLYRRYAGWLGGVLRRQLGAQSGAAEDLVQETYLRAARVEIDHGGNRPKALLRQIAINLARDHMRRHVIRGGLHIGGDEAERAFERMAHAPDQEQQLMLKQVVLGLPAIYRDVFLLSRFTDMTYDEIARHLGISVKTVEWRMSKALALCEVQIRD